MAKRDGYLVTMAPPESYLDPFTSAFTRSIGLFCLYSRSLLPL
jgi:hypothetical protein